MIKTALLKNYRIKEFIQFIRNTLMIVSEHGPDKLRIKGPYLALQKNQQQLGEAYKQAMPSELTPQLAQLDLRRDQDVICLRKASEAYTYHFEAGKKAAGQLIMDCIDKYGNKLYDLNYSAETAALKKLARDLQTRPEYVSAIRTMGLTEVVKDMEQANRKFEQLFVQRLKEFSESETRSTTELVQLSSEAYRTLVQHAEAHATLSPSPEYQAFIRHLNENIEHFNQIVERRKKSGEPEEVETTADESTEAALD